MKTYKEYNGLSIPTEDTSENERGASMLFLMLFLGFFAFLYFVIAYMLPYVNVLPRLPFSH